MGALLCFFFLFFMVSEGFFLQSSWGSLSKCHFTSKGQSSHTCHGDGPSVHDRMGAPGWKCHPRGTPPCLILAPENALGEYSPLVKSPSPEHSCQPCLAPWGQPETCRRSSKWDTGDTGSTRASRARASQPPAHFVLCSTHSTSVGLGAGRQHQQGGGEPGGTRAPLREPPLGAPHHG